MLLPARSGGKLCPESGKAARIHDLKCFEHLALEMRKPVFITLTVNRRNFVDEEAGYRMLAAKLPDLFHRLGIRVWGRVYEPQTESGGGWIHAHVVADLAGSGLRLGALAKRIWRLWRETWGIGGCDVKPAKSRRGVAGYMAKYLTKAWPAIPPWMLESTRRFRLVGFSRRASGVLQQRGLKCRRVARRVPGLVPRHRRRPCRPLIDRLAWSGMTCNAFERTTRADGTSEYRFLERLPVGFTVLAEAQVAGTRWVCEQERGRWRQLIRVAGRGALCALRRAVHSLGLVEETIGRCEWRAAVISAGWGELDWSDWRE